MDWKTILRNVVTNTRHLGLRVAMRGLFQRATTRFFEWRYGIWTEKTIHLRELGIDDAEQAEYGPTQYADFRKLLRRVKVRPDEDVFLDYGAGLGRAVILAGSYPFRRVIGVELSEELGETGRRNLDRARARLRCRDVAIVTCDATVYEVPADATMFYFNNPFHGGVLERVLVNMRRSLAATPRPMVLVCHVPGLCPFDTQMRAEKWLTLREEFALPSGRIGVIFDADGK